MKLLLDSSIIIEWEKGNIDAAKIVNDADISVSVLTAYETLTGLEGADRAKTMEFFNAIGTIPFDFADATMAAEIKRRLLRSGKLVTSVDIMIAAQAKRRDFVVVTKDKHFGIIKSVIGLDVIIF